MRHEDFSNEITIAASQSVREKEYWLKKLSGDLVKSSFPMDNKKKMIKQFNLDSLPFTIPHNLFSNLMKLSRDVDHLLYVILTAGLAILLHKYTENQDIIFGIPINKQELEGEFINTVLPLRIRVEQGGTFRELLLQVKDCIIEAIEYQNYPIDALLRELNLTDTGFDSDFPLFDVSILLENTHKKDYLMPVKPNVTFVFMKRATSIVGVLEYNSFLYERTTIEQIIAHYIKLLKVFLGDNEAKLSDVDLLSEQERQELVFDFNARQSDYPKSKTIHELFTEQAEKTPDDIAVRDRAAEPRELTYLHLDQKSNQLAKVLQGKGVELDTIVGIIMERSLEMVLGVIAVLKSGGAYLPIENTCPANRIDYILKDSNNKVVLSVKQNLPKMNLEFPVINLDLEDPGTGAERESTHRMGNLRHRPHMAYVIYTSGSTGKPKGVMIDHHNLVNYICWAAKHYVRNQGIHFPLFTPISFDLTVTSIFTPLITANAVVIYEGKDNVRLLEQLLAEDQVGAVKLTPSHLKLLADYSPKEKVSNIKRFIVGGEELETSLADDIHKKFKGNIEIFNEYGPTEATVGCMIHRYDPEKDTRNSIPIGRPADNTQIFILDKTKKPVPMGIVGELYISGTGVARGYLNNPELTAEKFCLRQPGGESCSRAAMQNQSLHFHYPITPSPHSTIYRTGDLARWIPGVNLNIEFLGRIDEQVKIRGYRVQLEGIQRRLSCHAGVKEVVVTAGGDSIGGKRVVAYVVPDSDRALTVRRLLHLEKNTRLSTHYVYDIADKMPVISVNKNETDFMHKKIFTNRLYSKHGITLDDGACVFDVGANIGMFALWVNHLVKNAQIYTIEPIPPIYEMLCLNMELYGINAKNNCCGLASVEEEALFSYYPNASMFSGRFPNTSEERESIKRFIFHPQVDDDNGEKKQLPDDQIEEILAEQLSKRQFHCPILTLSQIIKQNRIQKIDLLKIAAEKSEIEILNGIDDQDWDKIKQMVIEVHNQNGRLTKILGQMETNGYQAAVEKSPFFHQENIYYIYARFQQDKKVNLNGIDKIENSSLDFHSQWYSAKKLETDLKNYLLGELPDYMIPSAFIFIEKVPLTVNGKIDKKALPAPGVINRRKEFAAPRNIIEKRLREIWAEVLGMNKNHISIDANFFELGGDSINSIQVSSRLQKYKLRFDVKDLFDYPTIRGLANHVKDVTRVTDYQLVTGRVELIPIQRWFFENKFQDRDHYTQAIMIYNEYKFDEKIIQKVMSKIVEHHDALRMSYEFDNDTVVQINRGLEGNLLDFEKVNLENTDVKKLKKKMADETDRIQREINLTSGPLMKLRLFQALDGDYLFIAIHHLVVDGVSWRILMEDFFIGYNQVERGEEIIFQGKTDSFQKWAQKLLEYSQTPKSLNELEYWKKIEHRDTALLPRDYEINSEELEYINRKTINIGFSEIETNKLLKEVNRPYNTKINDILLTALGLAIKEWKGIDTLLINLESHGREGIIEDINTTRTLGWFTTQFPVILEMKNTSDLAYTIKFVKETLRRIPNKGIGYGILRYLVPPGKKSGLVFKKEPEISFNYLGKAGQRLSQGNKIQVLDTFEMKGGKEKNSRSFKNRILEIDGIVSEKKLQLIFAYLAHQYKRSSIDKLAKIFKQNLLMIIEHCCKKEEIELTPSDLVDDVELSIEELEEIQKFTNLNLEG
jgi:amino acid adenylation domain-containing protein/non-ribosomal peptide synthase protein (TIGR01720 family)/FkbM family methyltransferase